MQYYFPISAFFLFSIAILPFSTFIDGDIASPNFQQIRYKNCKSRFEILSVGVTNCLNTDRCEFKRDSEYTIQIAFKPDKRVDSLKTAVWAHLGDSNGALTRFHVENEDACSSSNITCPVEPDKIYYYTQSVNVLSEYPMIDLQVNWLLINPNVERNEQGLPVNREVCIKFLAKVKEE